MLCFAYSIYRSRAASEAIPSSSSSISWATLPKAKELRRVAELILTLGKSPALANRRFAFDRLHDREIASEKPGCGKALALLWCLE